MIFIAAKTSLKWTEYAVSLSSLSFTDTIKIMDSHIEHNLLKIALFQTWFSHCVMSVRPGILNMVTYGHI